MGIPLSASTRRKGPTTPFDMAVRNDSDRYHLMADVFDSVPKLSAIAGYAKQAVRDKLTEHTHYIAAHGADLPEVRDWTWPNGIT